MTMIPGRVGHLDENVGDTILKGQKSRIMLASSVIAEMGLRDGSEVVASTRGTYYACSCVATLTGFGEEFPKKGVPSRYAYLVVTDVTEFAARKPGRDRRFEAALAILEETGDRDKARAAYEAEMS